MKERILCSLRNISFVIIIALLGAACGDDKEESINVGNEGGNGIVTGTVAKVDVKKAGSLSSLIGDDVKFNITDLTVTGDINGDDIALIREMAGADVNGDETKGHLSKLNLKDANIVAGGNPYYIHSTTQPCYSKKDIVGVYMFRNCNKLETIVLPNNITEIGGGVFWMCTNLARVNLALVTQIGEGAFSGCNIKEFTVSENNRVYSSLDGVLFNKDKTELVMYPKAKSSQKYVIPNSVTSVNDEAFGNCNNLASITIGDNVARMNSLNIGSKLIEYIVTENNTNYSSLDGVLFDKDKTELIAYPTAKVSSSYIIPSSVIKIKKSVSFNSNLTTINLNNVTGIEAYPFSGGYIREFIVPVANPSYSVENGVLFNKKQTVLIAYPMGLMKDYEPNGQGSGYVIPNSVETIRAYAFYPILEMVTIDGAIHLKAYMLETLTIPASVQDIGLFAIYGAVNIHCKSEIPPRLLSYYSGELAGRNIYVPMSAVNAYKQAVGWREANIIGE